MSANFLYSAQHTVTARGNLPLAETRPRPKDAPKCLAVGDAVLSTAMKPDSVTAIMPSNAICEAVMLSVMTDEKAGRALSLLAGIDCELLVENSWTPLARISVGQKIAALSANGRHPQIGTVQALTRCQIPAGKAVAVSVGDNAGLFVNGIAVRCPA